MTNRPRRSIGPIRSVTGESGAIQFTLRVVVLGCLAPDILCGMLDSFEIIHAVRGGLDNLQVGAAESNVVWTKAIKTELCRIGRSCKFRCKVGAHAREIPKSNRDYGEWLYDVTWLEYDGDGCVTDAHLVAECEWGNGTESYGVSAAFR